MTAPNSLRDLEKRLSEASASSGFRIVPTEATDAMLNAARDWSRESYGKSIGNVAARGCYTSMLSAAPAHELDGAVAKLQSDNARLRALLAEAGEYVGVYANALTKGRIFERAKIIRAKIAAELSPQTDEELAGMGGMR